MGHFRDSSVYTGLIALADQLVASATNFLSGLIIGRNCAPDEFGLYLLGLSIVFLVTRLQGSLISTPYMVISPHLNASERADYTGSTLLHQAVLSFVTVALLSLAGFAFPFVGGPQGLAPVVWALVFTISLMLFREYARNICFSDLNFPTVFLLDLGASVVQIGGLLCLASNDALSARGAFWVIGVASGAAGVIWLVSMRKSLSLRLVQVCSDFRRNWEFGKWIFASSFLWEATVSVYPWILTYFHGTASTGVWAACFGAVAVANPLVLGMWNFFGPRIAHNYAQGGAIALRKIVVRSGFISSLLILPIFLTLTFFGGRLVAIFYGEQYAGNGFVVSLLSFDLLITTFRFSLSRALFVMGKATAEFRTNVIPLLVLAVLGIWLVEAFSAVGVAAGLLIGNMAVTLIKGSVFIAASHFQNLEQQR